MKIGLIDVDSHNYPNLALMKLSAWHKAQGDTVDWWTGWEQYDTVYMSKVFDETYSPDVDEPYNADGRTVPPSCKLCWTGRISAMWWSAWRKRKTKGPGDRSLLLFGWLVLIFRRYFRGRKLGRRWW